MKYAVLGYDSEGSLDSLASEDKRALHADHRALYDDVQALDATQLRRRIRRPRREARDQRALRERATYFQHAPEIWSDFPDLVAGVIHAEGVSPDVSAHTQVEAYSTVAATRLASAPEGELPEIQAWRRAFARMGLKPTQYRCASEALLRRYRKDGALPPIHPLVDLCNAASLAFAIPVAAFDLAEIAEHLEVRYASGEETYRTFAGEVEHPSPREVIFADAAGRAHARRWTNRQSRASTVRRDTTAVLIVAEALHDSARTDIDQLTRTLAENLTAIWGESVRRSILGEASSRFDF